MKNKVLRSLIVIALFSLLVVSTVSFCACQGDNTPGQKVPQYDSLSSRVKRVYCDEYIENWDYNKSIEVVTSLAELEDKYNILGASYVDVYFENNVIVLIRFRYASSDKNIEFKNIALKDDKFYPIFATNSPLQNEDSTADLRENIYMVEMDKRILEYEFENILVINRRDINRGSTKYNSIKTVFA